MEQPARTTLTQLGTILFAIWVAARHGLFGEALNGVRVACLSVQGVGSFVHVDLSWLPFALAMACFFRAPPSERVTRSLLVLLAAAQAASHAASNLDRYYAGHALAWDLGNFVQPMWRAAHGEAMSATWSSGAPLWGDHGSFAFFVFAPWVRVGSDPASALIVVQSLLTASFGPALYLLAKRLGLDALTSLAAAAALASSRALANAAGFDFHPECALPLLLTLLCVFHVSGRAVALLVTGLAAASLKDGAAMVVAMTALFLGARPVQRPTLLVAGLAAALACFDVLWLPRLSGWPSYVQMNASAAVDPGIAIETTLGRALSQGGLGWLHPVAWFGGAPWALAAGLSPKLAVKGLSFQYGFLWVPVGALGTLFALRWLGPAKRKPVATLWAVMTLAVNAPLGWPPSLGANAASFDDLRDQLAQKVASSDAVATDACTAPLLMDREQLLGLCQLDVAALTKDGTERWTLPSARALDANVVVIDRRCQVHGACLAEQLSTIQARGFALVGVVDQRFGVFRRTPSP